MNGIPFYGFGCRVLVGRCLPGVSNEAGFKTGQITYSGLSDDPLGPLTGVLVWSQLGNPSMSRYGKATTTSIKVKGLKEKKGHLDALTYFGILWITYPLSFLDSSRCLYVALIYRTEGIFFTAALRVFSSMAV